MMSRPPFSIDEFVGVRRAFDDGRGPADAWARMNRIAVWRLDDFAEQAGCRAWASFFAPVDPATGARRRIPAAAPCSAFGWLG